MVDVGAAAGGGYATIASAQAAAKSGTGTDGGSTTVATADFVGNCTSGNTIVVVVACDTGSNLPTYVRDTLGGTNNYALAVSIHEVTNNIQISIYYKKLASTGTNAVTATWPDSNQYRRIIAHEFTNIDTLDTGITASQIDHSANTDSQAVHVGPITPSMDGCLIYAGMMEGATSASSVTVGTDFTLSARTADDYHLNAEYFIQTTAASHSGTWTWNITALYQSVVASFKPVAL